jgi:tripartite ATP-independent transporter DctM subunit
MGPGLLAMLGYLVVIALIVRRRPDLAPPLAPVSGAEKLAALRGVWPIVLVFAVVFGGIYGGVFSPTEGAGVGAVMTLVLGLLRGELNRSNLKDALLGTAETSAMVFMIFLGADMMNALLALTEMPKGVAAWLSALTVPDLSIVLAVLLLYVLLGCVMDELSMLMLTLPVIFPAIMALDLWGLMGQEKAIWFGILVLTTVSIGMLAPPVGLNVYVVNNLARDVPMSETYRGVLPFLVWDGVRLLLLLLMPWISLGLMRWIYN